jgi:hypothetical protein
LPSNDLLAAQLGTVQGANAPKPPTIASAATIAPQTFLSFVSGTTQVATITPPEDGAHLLVLIFTNAAPGALLTSGNIKRAVTPVQNVPMSFLWNPNEQKYYPGSFAAAGVGGGSAPSQSQPANPSGTTSTTMVMMGLAVPFTPQGSGRLLVIISGDVTQSTTADGAKWQLSIGTGVAPVNGAALTGTQFGSNPTMTFLTGVLTVPFSSQAISAAQVQGTAVWIDIALAAITAGTASMSNLSVSVVEL